MTHPAWDRAVLALNLLAVDPGGMGGLWLRCRSGPVRDRLLAALPTPLPHRRLHTQISDEQLYGGVDLSATMAADKVVYQSGLLSKPSLLILPMAERTPPGLAGRLGRALDDRMGHALVALDEGAEPDEHAPSALTDRLGLHLDLTDVGYHETSDILVSGQPGPASVSVAPEALTDLTAIALQLGVLSLRAPLLALAAARAHAHLNGRDALDQPDLLAATELVLAPRATRIPESEAETDSPPPPENQAEGDRQDSDPSETAIPQETLLEAARAMLPPDLLERLAAGRASRSVGGAGTGAAKRGNRRGRPLPSRPGKLGGTARIDLVATLRMAAPWQNLRKRQAPTGQRLHIRPSDIRVKQYQETSDRLLIFVVDASGSAAMARLAEAKGAVELLLGQAYARRDHVALIAFRGTEAELLLPPTRSLVQTKRRLAALPGGGGTPMAAGLKAALDLAVQAKGRGLTPTVALLTDGRANIALDGSADRQAAQSDAMGLARALAHQGLPALIIDTGARPQPQLKDMAQMLNAPYLPLPRADAAKLGAAVSAALEA